MRASGIVRGSDPVRRAGTGASSRPMRRARRPSTPSRPSD